MLYTLEQLKHLEANKDDTYRFIGHGKATEQEKERLLKMDVSYLLMHEKHLITNYEDLK